MKERYDLVVIGAGPTAFGALQRFEELKKKGYIRRAARALIIDRESEPGGLARTLEDENGFLWDLGVHVTGASRFSAFLAMLDAVIEDWNILPRHVLADISHLVNAKKGSKENYAPYPVQNYINYFPEAIKARCLAELEQVDQKNNNNDVHETDFDNFGAFSQNHFGRTLQDVFIRPYNEKVWTVTLEEMNVDWVEGRVPKIDLPRLKMLCEGVIKEEDEKRFCFRYPDKCKGMGEIWSRLAKTFPEKIFALNTEVVRVDTENKELTFKNLLTNTSKTIRYELMLSTIPVTELNHLTGNIIPNLRLRHSKVILVGVALKLPQNSLASELSWAYYPRKETVFYRCTVISNFSSTMTPDPTKFWSVLCEIGRKPDETVDEVELTKQVINDLMDVGLVENEDQVHSTWFQVIPYGYPIPTINRKSEMEKCHRILEESQIYSRGRFGSWHYETSNQDNCFEIGRSLINRLFLDQDEPPF